MIAMTHETKQQVSTFDVHKNPNCKNRYASNFIVLSKSFVIAYVHKVIS